MAQTTFTYPDNKQVYVYYGLSKWLKVNHKKVAVIDGRPQWVDKTNAEIKQETDVALKQYLRDRIYHVYKAEQVASQEQAFDATFNEPEIE